MCHTHRERKRLPWEIMAFVRGEGKWVLQDRFGMRSSYVGWPVDGVEGHQMQGGFNGLSTDSFGWESSPKEGIVVKYDERSHAVVHLLEPERRRHWDVRVSLSSAFS